MLSIPLREIVRDKHNSSSFMCWLRCDHPGTLFDVNWYILGKLKSMEDIIAVNSPRDFVRMYRV